MDLVGDAAPSEVFGAVLTTVWKQSKMPGKLHQQLADMSTTTLPAASPRQKYFGDTTTTVKPLVGNRQ